MRHMNVKLGKQKAIMPWKNKEKSCKLASALLFSLSPSILGCLSNFTFSLTKVTTVPKIYPGANYPLRRKHKMNVQWNSYIYIMQYKTKRKQVEGQYLAIHKEFWLKMPFERHMPLQWQSSWSSWGTWIADLILSFPLLLRGGGHTHTVGFKRISFWAILEETDFLWLLFMNFHQQILFFGTI